MRKHLFAKDEILLHTDAMDLQDNASLDMSALLGALQQQADGAVTGGIDAIGVLVGLTATTAISGTDVVITVQPGSILYTVQSDSGINYRIATIRDTVTLTLAGGSSSTKTYAIVEALIAETTDAANREFKRDMAGRVVVQTESTPKLAHTTVTLRVRAGNTVGLADTVYVPAIATDALPLWLVYTTTDGSSVVTAPLDGDMRKVYRSNTGSLAFASPLHVWFEPTKTDPTGGTVAVAQTLVGFGERTPLDYLQVVQRSNANVPIGSDVYSDTGSVPSGSSTVGYLYACRIHPKSGSVFLVETTKYPDLNRNLATGQSITVPQPWQSMTVSGKEAVYLSPIVLGASGVRSGVDVNGPRVDIYHNYPEVTVGGQTGYFTMDLSAALPLYATGVQGVLTIIYTAGGAACDGATILHNGVSTPYPNGTVTAAPGDDAAVIHAVIPYTAFNMNVGRTIAFEVISRGTNVGTFDAIFSITGFTEMLRA